MQRLNTEARQFADQLANAIQHELLAKGKFSELAQLLIEGQVQQEVLEVELEASGKQLFPEMKLRFDMFFLPPKEEGEYWAGFVPVLGLTAVGKEQEDLLSNMRDNILLEFIRNQRVSHVPGILGTQWFQEVSLKTFSPDFFFYTLSELEQMQQTKEEELLKKMLTPFHVSNSQLIGLEEKYEQLVSSLKSKASASILVVGKSGMGKTELIRQFISEKAKHGMNHVKVWQTTAAQLIHRLTAMGRWEDYLAQMCNELRATGDVLYFPNLASLFEVGQYVGNSLSVADYLRDYIGRGDITVLTELYAGRSSAN